MNCAVPARPTGLFLPLALLVVCAPLLRAAECPGPLSTYTGYKVRQIRLFTPIQFFSAATSGFNELKAELPLQEGKAFSPRALSEGNVQIKEYIKSQGADVSDKFKFVVVVGQAENCDASSHALDVLYMAFTNIYRPYLSRTFEMRNAEVVRPSTTSGEGGTSGRLLIRPLMGYNNTLHGYGGFDLSSTIPVAGLKSIELHPSFSSNSVDANGSLNSSWRPQLAALEHAGLRFGFQYLDQPAGAAQLKEGKLTAQFFAATRTLGTTDTILRYGMSLEGGHQQNKLPLPLTAPGVAPNSGYGAVKAYLGATGRLGRQSFSASYGLQAGSTLSGAGVDFIKHIADLAATIRFLRVPSGPELAPPSGVVHRPFDLELRGTAGTIQQMGSVPAAERFFGGNQVQPFISSDGWIVPGGAYIRSIPQNRLGGLDAIGRLGGTHFYSANVTLAKVIWGRPLVPAELAHDPEFVPNLQGAVNTVKGELEDYYKAHDPAARDAFKAATAELDGIVATNQQITARVAGLPGTIASDAAFTPILRTVRSKIRTSNQIVAAIKAGSNDEFNALVDVQMPALRTALSSLALLLQQKGLAQDSQAFSAFAGSHEAAAARIKADLARLNSPAATAWANQEFSAADKVLRAFLYELNIYSIAPVAVFDVARVWPASTPTRYAAGAGVRLGLVNVNFTLAYAVNPSPIAGEGRGALFVKLDVEDLFR